LVVLKGSDPATAVCAFRTRTANTNTQTSQSFENPAEKNLVIFFTP
jgi:hypothetical protein